VNFAAMLLKGWIEEEEWKDSRFPDIPVRRVGLD